MNDLVNHAKAIWHRKQALVNLLDKLNNDLVFAYNGGLFRADRELISFLNALKPYDTKIVKDINDVPIEVDINQLFDLAIEKYTYATNEWAVEYKRLSKIRSIKDVL